MSNIVIKAGETAYTVIKDGGFTPDQVTTYVGPGVGPRWLIASGFDLTFLAEGILGRSNPVLLAGTSAGALRFAAWLQPEAEKSYRRLMEGYITTSYDREHTPGAILESLRDIIDDYMENDALPFALANDRYRLAITAARSRNLVASEISWIQRLGLAFGYVGNAVTGSWLYNFFQRVVFYSGLVPPRFCLRDEFKGLCVKLNEINIKHALLASAAIPLVVAGVKDIYGAPNGVYRDGGLTDYHVNQRYGEKEEDIVLLFHHQERIIPGWLDKKLRNRNAPAENRANVLMIYPSQTFVEGLPGGKIPDRDDFKTFVDNPAERIKNWWRAVELSSSLGEEFLDLVESGKIRTVVEKL